MDNRFCNYDDWCHHNHVSGGDSEATIEMNGEDNKSVVQQSAGLHFLEVNNSGDCQGKWP